MWLGFHRILKLSRRNSPDNNKLMLNAANPNLSVPIGIIVAENRIGSIPVEELLGITVLQRMETPRNLGCWNIARSRTALQGDRLTQPFRIIPEQMASWVSEVIIRKNYSLADIWKLRLFAGRDEKWKYPENAGGKRHHQKRSRPV